MSVRIQMRRDSLANWTSNDPILAEGEMGLELDTNRWKIGNGIDSWDSLPYSNQIFSGPSTITDNSSGTALKITQTGSGNAFVVQDSPDPDSTHFVIDNVGYVGIQKTTPTVPLDVDGEANFSGQITSTVPTGSSPLVVASTTAVDNLNADLLDGQHGAYYSPVDSPTLTGIPAAPTASADTNTTQIATTEFVTSAISGLSALPSQSGNEGKYLTTDGANASWNEVSPGNTTDPYIVSFLFG